MDFRELSKPIGLLVILSGGALGLLLASTPRPPQFSLVLEQGFLPENDGGRFLGEVASEFRSSLSNGGIETEFDSGQIKFEVDFEDARLTAVIRESWTQSRERIISQFESDLFLLKESRDFCLDSQICVLAVTPNDAKYLYLQAEAENLIPVGPPELLREQPASRILTPENALIGASAGGALAASIFYFARQLRRIWQQRSESGD